MYEGRATAYFREHGLPTSDSYDLSPSPHRFPDGAHYRIEVPTINSVPAMNRLLRSTESRGVHVNRLSVTYGIMRYTDSEISDMVALAQEYGAELFMMVGPRATLDIGAQAHIHTLNAQHVAYRLRGTDQLLFGVEDALRAIDLGCRGILACDEGLLLILKQMRDDGTIPSTVRFKASVLMGTTNFLNLRIIEQTGADSINIQRDMPLPMVASFRATTSLPLDWHANNPGQTGGFVRTYDAPKIVEVAAPIYIKTGNIAVPEHSMMVDEAAGERMAREVEITVRHIEKFFPDGTQTPQGHPTLAIPEAGAGEDAGSRALDEVHA